MLLCLGTALAATLHGGAASAGSANRVVVEMDPANPDLDQNLVRRLVRLELADVVIPPPHGAPGSPSPPPLYVRIEGRDGHLLVELWERGLLQGERRVSVRGSKELTARSVALVTAELAERLGERRKTEARLAAARERRELRRSMEQRGYPLFARIAAGAAIESANLGTDRQWLLGPGVDVEMRFAEGPRIALLTRGFTGRAHGVNLQWVEAGMAPGYLLKLSRRSALGLELFATAAAVSVPEANRLDGSTSSTTWNARVGAGLSWEYRFWPNVPTHAGIRIGSTARKLGMETADASRLTIGGVWLGLELGATFDHVLPP